MQLIPSQKNTKYLLRLHLAVALMIGLFVLWSYLQEPSEPGSAVLFGFSFLRLILIGVVLFLLMGVLILLLGSLRNRWELQMEALPGRLAKQEGLFWIALVCIAMCYILLFLSDQQLGTLASYRERLSPILLWLALLSVQFILFLFYARGIGLRIAQEYRSIFLTSFVILVLFGLLVLFISLTRVGLTPDNIYWQEPGAPILLHQVFLAIFGAVLFYWLIEHTNLGRSNRLDQVLFLGLWGFAFLVWLSQPAQLTWFSLEATAPNYQNYPFSDALVYDHAARQFLTGKPIPSDFWYKPVYSFFLTILHLFAGGNYTFLISLQVFFGAMIPALAYLLMVRLGIRPAGIVAALLLVLREHNALALSNVIQVSHVKLLLSDLFAMGLMVLLLYLFFHWVERPGERRVTPLVIGGVLGLLILTRGHPIVLLPFVLCTVCFVPFSRSYLRWESIVLTLLGFIILLLPWFWRNYELTGRFAFQYPASPYSAQMSNAYSLEPSVLDPQNVPPRNSGESDLAYYDRLGKQATTFAWEHPDYVAKFISAHYFHNSIFSYIYLPYSFRIENIKDYVKTEPFWRGWTGELSFQGRILLFINLALIALGFGYLWKTHRHLAFAPLLFGIGYNLSVSAGRLSGWRFILPADWITLIYFSIGLMQFYRILRSFAGSEAKFSPEAAQLQNTFQPLKRSSLTGWILVFLSIGMALTRGHQLFSQRYPVKSTLQLIEDYRRATTLISSAPTGSDLEPFLETDGAVIVYGQALHPYFLPSNDEKLDNAWSVYYFWPSYKPRPFPRMIFNLNGPQSAGVVLPMESPPASFPDGADVIVVGCLAETGEINARSVVILGDSPIHYDSEPPLTSSCASPKSDE